MALAEAIREGLARLEPSADIFFSPVSLGSGFWQPKLATEIATADAFLLLIGPSGIGPWQEVEYFAAVDRHVNDKTFALVPVMAPGAQAPGLPLLRILNWVEAPSVTEDAALYKVLAALKGDAPKNATPLWKLVNPYRGLEAMTEANADYFYGRSDETTRVLNALAVKPDRLPILVGASGVGKSSVAQAGVLAALKAMRWPGGNGAAASQWPAGLTNSRGFLTLILRPGEAPMQSMAGVFIGLWGLDTRDPEHAALPRKWAKGLSVGDNKLSDLISATQQELKRRQGEAPERVLLYLDQGEELYIRSLPRDARRFSELLHEGLNDPRMCAFASLRADYFDRFQADEPLFSCREHIDVPPLGRAQLRQVVATPPAVLGVSFEDDKIADRITASAAAEPGALPLLSYLLTKMWGEMIRRDRPILGLPAQAIDIGGVLASNAEDFLKDNPEEEKAIRRLLTLRLAVVPPEGEPMRRQTFRDECSEAEWALAARLAEYPYRLVVISERGVDGRFVAEVAHEAFLRAWPRLAEWLREERDFLVFKGEAERAERQWREMGKLDKALLSGLDLARAEEWLPKRSEDLSAEVTSYVQGSIALDRAIKQRQLRFQRRVMTGAIVATILIGLFCGFAWLQWRSAEQALQKAFVTQSRFLADLANQRTSKGDAASAVSFALAALPDSLAPDNRPYVPEAEAALQSAWQRLREVAVLAGHQSELWSVKFSADGRFIFTTSRDGTARIWDGITGKNLFVFGDEGDPEGTRGTISPDGRLAATTGFSGPIRIWDTHSGKLIAQVKGGHLVKLHNGRIEGRPIAASAFSPDDNVLITVGGDTTARIWDVKSGKQLRVLMGHTDSVIGFAISPNGEEVVTASTDKTLRVWNIKTGAPLRTLTGHEGAVYGVQFSPDGTRLVSYSEDKTARIWDVETGDTVAILTGHTDQLNGAEFSPDGRRVLTASSDRTARIWDSNTGKILQVLSGHAGAVQAARFSPDGERVLTVASDHTARLWRAQTGDTYGVLVGHTDEIYDGTFRPDGRHVVTASRDGTARIWNAEWREDFGTLAAHAGNIEAVRFSPDGHRTITVSEDNVARIWNADDGIVVAILKGHEGTITSVSFSPDGRRVLTASRDGTARVWNAQSGQEVWRVKHHNYEVGSAEYSPDGTRVITGSGDGSARIWDANSGSLLVTLRVDKSPPFEEKISGAVTDDFMADRGDPVRTVHFTADGRRVVTGSSESQAVTRLWDAQTGEQLRKFDVYPIALSPDGRYLVSSRFANQWASLDVWDTSTGQSIKQIGSSGFSRATFSPHGDFLIAAFGDSAWLFEVPTFRLVHVLRGHDAPVSGISFSEDGQQILTSSDDATARVWDTDGNAVAVLMGHTRPVNDARFSHDGKFVITGSDDGTARTWRVFQILEALITEARQATPRCLTVRQRETAFLDSEPPAWCIDMGKWPYQSAAWEQWLADTRAGKHPHLPAGP